MTQENKDLLLKDLCARLPYGVKVHIKGEYHKSHKIEEIDVVDGFIRYFENMHLHEEKIIDCKPYLRSLSSMTKDEQKEFVEFHCVTLCPIIMDSCLTIENECNMFDWLNAHHLDYHGLIPKGLAIAVTEDNNPYKAQKGE